MDRAYVRTLAHAQIHADNPRAESLTAPGLTGASVGRALDRRDHSPYWCRQKRCDAGREDKIV